MTAVQPLAAAQVRPGLPNPLLDLENRIVDAGFRRVPVDASRFPDDSSNLDRDLMPRRVQAVPNAIENAGPDPRGFALIPGKRTRNIDCPQDVAALGKQPRQRTAGNS